MKAFIIFFGYYLLVILIFAPRPALAYIDPGTGSFVFQIVMGALFGAVFIVKMWWKSIKLFLTNVLHRKEVPLPEKPTSKK